MAKTKRGQARVSRPVTPIIAACLTVVLLFSSFRLQKEAYATTKIGKQTWMAQNLNVDKFSNGDPIPEARTNEEWAEALNNKKPAWCYLNNDPKTASVHGRLYNWYAVADKRGLAPKGWHVPNQNEAWELINHLGEKSALKMRSDKLWKEGKGTNQSGFNAMPTGARMMPGHFYYFGEYAMWWTTSESPDNENMAAALSIRYFFDDAGVSNEAKGFGLPVRCVKD